jgi:hypothetical protein
MKFVPSGKMSHPLFGQVSVLMGDGYFVFRRATEVLGMAGTHLIVVRKDGQPIHDWRDLQAIKSAVCGDEAEGVELYPAESRLGDTTNAYHLWVLPTGCRFNLGFDVGRLLGHIGPQRPRSENGASNDVPPGLER